MRQKQLRGSAGQAARILAIGVSVGALGACDSLLEVELPHILTDEAISNISSAQIQVNSAQALFECGASSMSWIAMGHEDIFESVAGVAGGAHVFLGTPGTGTCDSAQSNGSFFDQFMGTRQLISTDPAKLGNSGGSSAIKGIYDRLIDDGWMGQITGGERLAAIAAVYGAEALGHFAQYYCEGTFDAGRFMTADELNAVAQDWVTNRALVHITNVGDFAMPNGASSSAQRMALGLRAQLRLAAGDLAGANADAQTILGAAATFAAYATRESGSQRRNKVYDAGTAVAFSGMIGVNTWWGGPSRNPNPATGTTWPNTIPFTGYIFLGVMPDGRTLEASNVAVRWASEIRSITEAPVSLGNGAVVDTRVPHIFKSTQGPAKREVPNEFTTVDTDIPLVTFRELQLIRARYENEVVNTPASRQIAINIINTLRPAAVPDIDATYGATLTASQAAMRLVILEEARRELYGGEYGRWWQWKIQHTDLMWFPRFEGFVPSGYRYQGGVRLAFPVDEYDRNPAFVALGGRDARGSGCSAVGAGLPADVSERPRF
ncbi:MAG TPA: hypothetical protein VFO67_07225 [Gemmatimonadales bacterium]|nr:hypothetical protein [Gemmatimonadales bacterium]